MSKKKTNASGGKRFALIVLCVILGLLLTVMLGGTIYAEYLLSKLNYVDSSETLPTLSDAEIEAIEAETEAVDPEFTGPVLSDEDIDFGDGPNVQIGGEDEDSIVNILLIGQDTRTGVRSRSDAMILCTFNTEKNTITLTSFMRDLYVQIPGYKNNRINAAFAYGGIPLLNETLEVNFGIHVDGNVEVDFNQFADIIDLLGGVEMELSSGEVYWINKNVKGASVKQGWNLLNGDEALMHARNRNNVDGDFSRTNRQRQLLSALIDKYKNSSLTDMVGMLDDILPMVTTDMTKKEITNHVMNLFPMLASCEIITQHIPVDGGFQNAVIGGAQVLVPDMEKNINALVDSLAK